MRDDLAAGELAGAVESIARNIASIRRSSDRRSVIAIAGPPASGKSTLAELLRGRLEGDVAVLGLDAFHYDDAILSARGHSDRKGAPHTFDITGFAQMLRWVRSKSDVDLAIPKFDRALELSRNCAEIVPANCDVIITEGNYLLLDEPGWSELRPWFDLTVMVHAEVPTVEARILNRWLGFGFDEKEAWERASRNDLPNADLVRQRSADADLTIHNG